LCVFNFYALQYYVFLAKGI